MAANNITFTGSLSIVGPDGQTRGKSFTNLQFNQTNQLVIENDGFLVLTSATLIPLGGLTNPHWSIWQNLDPTNYVTIFNGASGAVLARLLGASAGAGPYGDCAFIPLDPGCVPYAQANTASVMITYLIAAA